MKQAIAAAVSLALVVSGVIWAHSRARPPLAAVTSGALRVERTTCAECHPGIAEDFATAPHAGTLRRGDDPEILPLFAGKTAQLDGRTFRFTEADGELWFQADDVPHARRVDWIFGSGHHALTPVSIDEDRQGRPRITQLHVSRFADGSLRATPGSRDLGSLPPRLGRQEDVHETQRCFGCHVSWLPEVDQRPAHLDLARIVPNLDCSRCHAGAAGHAASEGERELAFDWDELTPLESIHRCGECHRRADEMTEAEVTEEQTHLIRFAPVGLEMSRCFQVANAPENASRYPRFDCITCHDPHLPTRTDAEFFNAKCRQCHTAEMHPRGGAAFLVTCSQQAADSSCIDCHMTKKELVDGLSFTDHWIRRDHGLQ